MITEDRPYDPIEDQACEDAAFAKRAVRASQLHRAVLVGRFGDSIPAEEAEGTPAFEAGIAEQIRLLVETPPIWLNPVGEFQFPQDWDACEIMSDEHGSMIMGGGRLLPLDPSVERRLDPLVRQATGAHKQHHASARHPWCETCHLRLDRSAYRQGDINNAYLTDDDLRHVNRTWIEARVRGVLLRGGRLPDATPKPIPKPGLYHSVSELRAMKPRDFLVDGLIPDRGVGYLVGRDQSYKTFLALDVAMHLVTDLDWWHGRKIGWMNAATLVYVAGEGAYSFGARVEGWLQSHEDETPAWRLDRRMTVRSGSVNLFTGGPAYDELLAVLRERLPIMVVIDTHQTNTTGADANSAGDMGQVTARLKEMEAITGGVVLVVAHTGKSDEDARGSSAIEDDADFVINVKRDESTLTVKVTKQKDAPDDFEFNLWAKAEHDTIVLHPVADQPAALFSSSSLDNRIATALKSTASTGLKSAADVRAIVSEDGYGAVSRAMEKTLSTMIEDNRVLRTKIANSWKYELNEAWVDKRIAPRAAEDEGWSASSMFGPDVS